MWDMHFLVGSPPAPAGELLRPRISDNPQFCGPANAQRVYDPVPSESALLPQTARTLFQAVMLMLTIPQEHRPENTMAVTIEEFATLLTRGQPVASLDARDSRLHDMLLRGCNGRQTPLAVYQPPTDIPLTSWSITTDIDSVMFLSPTRIPVGSGQFYVCHSVTMELSFLTRASCTTLPGHQTPSVRRITTE